MVEHDGAVLARLESDDRVFEVRFDALEPTDVTLRFLRDGDRVIGVEVPKEFVAEILDAALETGRVTDETAAEGYRLRVL